MTLYSWNDSPVEQLNALVSRQVLHSPSMTVARIRIRKGGAVPEHAHLNEQISTVYEGTLRFNLAGEEVVVRTGESLVIPPNVPHSVLAEEDALALDLFTPPRQDWISGDDAYLRR
jgi:quercetin dioxygenase-like cupin family protein